jgi:hypothetical protein
MGEGGTDPPLHPPPGDRVRAGGEAAEKKILSHIKGEKPKILILPIHFLPLPAGGLKRSLAHERFVSLYFFLSPFSLHPLTAPPLAPCFALPRVQWITEPNVFNEGKSALHGQAGGIAGASMPEVKKKLQIGILCFFLLTFHSCLGKKRAQTVFAPKIFPKLILH